MTTATLTRTGKTYAITGEYVAPIGTQPNGMTYVERFQGKRVFIFRAIHPATGKPHQKVREELASEFSNVRREFTP